MVTLGELTLHVLDQSAEHERLEDLVQAGDDDDLLLLLHPVELLAVALLIVPEPLLEHLGVVEHLRKEQVEQRPQLAEIVLQRRPREQQSTVAPELVQVARQSPLAIFQSLRLVDDDVLPVHLAELRAIAHDELVGGDEDVELELKHLLREDLGAFLSSADVIHRLHALEPRLDLRLPVDDDGVGDDDEVRAVVLLALPQVGDQRAHLHGLPQAHLVRQDAVEAVVVQGDHPLQPRHLV